MNSRFVLTYGENDVAYWVCEQMVGTFDENWYGPFVDRATAQRAVEALTDPRTPDGPADFATIVVGEAGREGRRLAEFYQGREFPPGRSGWDAYPVFENDIPADAGT